MQIISKDYGFSRSAAERSCVDRNGSPVPWYTYPAIEFLSQFCYEKYSVFEYGSGNSTLFWSARAANVTSIEHDPAWYDRMQPVYAQKKNVSCILQSDPEKYTALLDREYDIIVVDANWRAACSARALQYVRDGGMIILDDSERAADDPEYQEALKYFEADPRFIRIDFSGFAPLVDYTKITTVFLARNNHFERKK